MRECSEGGCSCPVTSRGLCEAHYRDWLKTRSPGPRRQSKAPAAECSYEGCSRPARAGTTICKHHYTLEWRARQGECSVKDCGGRVDAGGLCEAHYSRKRRGVLDWDAPITRRIKRGGTCSVTDCPEPVQARGRCAMHYQRVARLGHADPGPAGRLKAVKGAGSSDGRGYRVITVGGQRYLEHRWVMEQQLGRPLWPDEQVHHRNRRRADNRPENLELWTTAQPSGGRMEDLVAFYVGRYPDEARRALERLGT